MFEIALGSKRCRQCGQVKTLPFFPRDRSRPDGRWHSCRACNRHYWVTQGKLLTAERKARSRAQRGHFQGLAGLRHYRHEPVPELFARLRPDLRDKARLILSRSLERARHQGRRLSQQQIAARIGNAASNACRASDRSWARRMWRLKGYRRAERMKAEEEARLAEIRARNAGKPRWSWRLEGI